MFYRWPRAARWALVLSAAASVGASSEFHEALKKAGELNAKGDFAAVVRLLTPWVERHADSAEGQYRLGIAYFQQQDYPPAIRHLSTALKLEQEGSALWKQTVENLALSYYFTNRPRDALPLLEKATAWNLQDPSLHYALAMSYVYARDFEKSRQAFARLFDVPPDSPQASLLTSHFMIRENLVSDAEALIRQAQEEDPTLPDANYRLGVVALTNGKLAEAVDHFKAELARNPSHPMAWHYLGFAYSELGELNEAVDPLQRAIWLNVLNAPSYVLLGTVYAKLEKYSLAENALGRALELVPESYEAHFQLARIYHKTNRAELASKEMEIARRLREEKDSFKAAP